MNRTIGVIANPASGKDIRRLVSYATTIDNNEKVNICKRIVLAAQGLGIERVLFMPETFMIGWAVREGLESDGVLRAQVELLDFEIEAAQEDTTRAARMLEEQGVGCVVVLGGKWEVCETVAAELTIVQTDIPTPERDRDFIWVGALG